jgi:divalent metal cation (Fe/Co/Zn/Cd) transporter
MSTERRALVRRGLTLNYVTLVYNSLEGVLSLGAGIVAGSIALVGFGADSVIELAASVAALWRLRADLDEERRERVEILSHRFIGVSFLALALYVGYSAIASLLRGAAPQRSLLGVGIALASLIVMPALARAKRRVAARLTSGALAAEAKQTMICAYLSAILLAGLGLRALAGWWWADPLAGLAMVPFMVWEGIEGVRGRCACGNEAGHAAR